MSVNIESKLDNNFWNVDINGELDVAGADKVKTHLNSLIEEQPVDIKMDFTNLEYIDSTGLGALIGVLKRLKVNDKDIYVLNARKNVKKIFSITGLDKIFKVEG
ncbi:MULTISPECIES: STAS domain-containing protein [Paraclostridium]|jgi:anti-sigma B factor antagonist|uniref:Anti-sigma factor antagonist n=2 Tax=Paraclostridium bifermentans TaxID=1490 RepID=A0A1X2JDI2_PARBF|nr:MULTISPECIES: STAS domain-containing protein [Paraclostridium]KGJ48487.1 anti-sigma factor antagonist [Clostridium sp. NCR]MCU9807566.1 STAS domain-containing protein [Paraclostridium sp. AKS46]MDU7904109.1 STAS domain-containing protein [Peptostreptococcaceae bacterium]MDV8113969.1 STAS domain-containing protein [Bacillus sp. BAU-SS-2023]EQK40596.1 anti-anti-sigma factor family protein [[Clostridium] bifermentans ATCC 638] [Paraclostridium bifermentans ATCC 638 = DSM 14991]